MFSNVKKQIKELAKNAVIVAESTLGSGAGQEKKKMAVGYIVGNLPFPNFIKTIISVLLSSFIDDVVELAVCYMNSLQNTTKGE